MTQLPIELPKSNNIQDSMKEYINKFTTKDKIIDVVSMLLKTTDDKDGKAGEHWLVKCRFEHSSILSHCLVSVEAFRRFIKQTEVAPDTVKWLKFEDNEDEDA